MGGKGPREVSRDVGGDVSVAKRRLIMAEPHGKVVLPGNGNTRTSITDLSKNVTRNLEYDLCCAG